MTVPKAQSADLPSAYLDGRKGVMRIYYLKIRKACPWW